jgi:hypothetical protein
VHGLVELEENRPAYMLAWEQYDGTARSSSRKTHRVDDELGQYSEHFRINVTRKVIKARLNRLKINSISVADGTER